MRARAGTGPALFLGGAMNRITLLTASQQGQTTAEYSLVLLVAGLVVGVFAAFVKSGELQHMFHTIISGLIQRAQG
jgi:uncharacterized protein (UPF0333 family)